MIKETRKRTIFKTIGWRTIGLIITFISAITINLGLALAAASSAMAIAILDMLLKSFAYFGYERAWDKIRYGKSIENTDGCCIWMTGFSGAGKTTIAIALKDKLEKVLLKRVEYLDGDIVRKTLTSDLGFSKEDRDENIKRVSYVASFLSQKAITICAFISPYKKAREKARSISNNFIEVHVDCPIEVCENRDVKGLYKKARSGEIKEFTGISDPYEPPENPEIYIDTNKMALDECVNKIVMYLKNDSII